MILTISLIWLCLQGQCIEVIPEAAAVIACESGDTKTIGTGKWDAINDNVDGTSDGGAFQFNDFWVWSTDDFWVIRPVAAQMGMTPKEFLSKWPSGFVAPPEVQYQMFLYLWDSGRGAWHWNASRSCWSELMEKAYDRRPTRNGY